MSDQFPPPPPYGPPPGQPPYGPPPYGGPPSGPYGGAPRWDIGEVVKYSWRMLVQHLGPLLFLGISAFVLGLVPLAGGLAIEGPGAHVGVASPTDEGFWAAAGVSRASVALNLTVWVLSVVLGLALLRAALDITSGRPVTIGSLFTRWHLGRLLLAGLLGFPIVAVGLLLCVLPGIAALFFLYLTPYFVMDRGLGPVAALLASARLVRDNLGTMLLLALVVVGSWLLATVTCGLASVVLGPMATIATAYTYRFVQGEPIAQPQPATP